MISLSEQMRSWRSRYHLSKYEAARVLGISVGSLAEIEMGRLSPRGKERDELIQKFSRPPNPAIRGSVPDPGYSAGGR